MAASKYNTKLKWTRKKEGNEINNVSPKKTKRSKSIVKLPSVKNINFTEHNKFNIGEILGEGAFAKVRLAHRKSDGLKCVIKMYEKNRLKT